MSDSKTALEVYVPSTRQRLAKAKFWQVMETNWRDPSSLSINEIAQITGYTNMKDWLGNSEFQSWFFNSNMAHQKVQAAKELAVEALIDILGQPIDPKEGVTAPSKVRAAEILMQYAGMEPPKRIEKKTTQGIVSNMDPAQLKSFLQTHMKKLILSMTPEDRDELLDVIVVTESKEPTDA